MPMLYTNEMIWNKLQEIEKSLEFLKQREIENLIDEISLHKASKLVRRNPDLLKSEVEAGNLAAMIELGKNNIKQYRFKVADLLKWQDSRQKNSEHLINTAVYDPNFAKKYTEEFHRKNRKKKK